MNDRKNALLLSGVLFLCVWLVLFIVAVTETGTVAHGFGVASTVSGALGAGCVITWLALDFMEERRDASGIYSFKYYRLKRRTMKELKNAQKIRYSDPVRVLVTNIVKISFFREATIIGIPEQRIEDDLNDMLEAVK